MVLGLQPGGGPGAPGRGAGQRRGGRLPVQRAGAGRGGYFIPAGLVHAIGRGIVVYECSRTATSPTACSTITGPGWTASPAWLHIAQSLDAAHYDLPPARPPRASAPDRRARASSGSASTPTLNSAGSSWTARRAWTPRDVCAP